MAAMARLVGIVTAGVACGALLAGCESRPTFDVYSANFAVTKSDTLCAIYGTNSPRMWEARQELERRGVFSAEDWARIGRRELYKGQSECGLLAAFGLASKRYVFVDDKTGAVLQRQFFYDCKSSNVPDCPFTDIVTENDRVMAWSPAQSS